MRQKMNVSQSSSCNKLIQVAPIALIETTVTKHQVPANPIYNMCVLIASVYDVYWISLVVEIICSFWKYEHIAMRSPYNK